MLADLQWGVLTVPPLGVAEVLVSGLPLEEVMGPPLEEAAREERESGLGVVQ